MVKCSYHVKREVRFVVIQHLVDAAIELFPSLAVFFHHLELSSVPMLLSVASRLLK